MNLELNQCSKAILKQAGNGLKESCEQWIKENGQLKEGHFAITPGAKLKCRKVIHVVCPKWSADQGEKVCIFNMN